MDRQDLRLAAFTPPWLARLAPLLFAVLCVQAGFWLVVNPTLINPSIPPFEVIEAKSAEFALLDGSDRASLGRARYEPLERVGEGRFAIIHPACRWEELDCLA